MKIPTGEAERRAEKFVDEHALLERDDFDSEDSYLRTRAYLVDKLAVALDEHALEQLSIVQTWVDESFDQAKAELTKESA